MVKSSSNGRQVGPYRLLEEIGRGSQGQVYLAEDTRLARKVALKLLSQSFAPSADTLVRFQREAAAASRLDHPGICAVYEAGEAEGIHYIAMRHLEGETLARKIAAARAAGAGARPQVVAGAETLAVPRRRPPPPEAAPAAGADGSSTVPSTREEIVATAGLIERAARALHSAHEAGLIHRDIKPGNIMVTREGEPVILDFGLARDEESDVATLTHSGDLLGTPAYMSPEQLLAQRIPLDRRTDVYSLGATLYECLTLRRPFDAPTREGLYQQILTASPPDPTRINRRIPRDLKVVLETALEKDRNRRYQTALDFAEDLRRVRTLEPIRARPAGPILRVRRWSQRNPVLATVMVLLALGLAVSLALLEQVHRQKRATEEALQGKDAALLEVKKERDDKARALAEKAEALAAKEDALMRAEGLYLTAQASMALPRNPGLALLLALEGAARQKSLLSTNVLVEALKVLREERMFPHPGGVLSASFSPDGRQVLSASWDGGRLWDARSGRLLHFLPSSAGGLSSFHPRGERVLTVSASDSTAQVWDAAAGRPILTLAGHLDRLTSCSFSPDGLQVLTSSEDGTARIWDAQSGRSLAVMKPEDCGVHSAAFSPDGRQVLTGSDGRIRSVRPAAGGGVVRSVQVKQLGTTASIWDASSGRELFRLPGHQGRVECSFSPDGT